MSCVTPGCVVSDPPEYGVARQTPPFLDLGQAEPQVFVLREVPSGDQQTFKVGVRSEDAGDELLAQLYLDYLISEPPPLLNFVRVPPSTFDDTSRKIEIPFLVPNRPGCHQVSMVVTHSSNLGPTNKPIVPSDVGIATWWVSIDEDDQDPSLVRDCPSQLGGTQ
jgi:hypothetical protein